MVGSAAAGREVVDLADLRRGLHDAPSRRDVCAAWNEGDGVGAGGGGGGVRGAVAPQGLTSREAVVSPVAALGEHFARAGTDRDGTAVEIRVPSNPAHAAHTRAAGAHVDRFVDVQIARTAQT